MRTNKEVRPPSWIIAPANLRQRYGNRWSSVVLLMALTGCSAWPPRSECPMSATMPALTPPVTITGPSDEEETAPAGHHSDIGDGKRPAAAAVIRGQTPSMDPATSQSPYQLPAPQAGLPGAPNQGQPSEGLPPALNGPQGFTAEQIPAGQPDGSGSPQVVAEVAIVGNETISLDRIYSLIHTRKNRPFDPEILQQDKRNLMTKGLFRDVRIATQQTAHGIVVTFEVFERPTIHYIVFLGDRGIGEKTLLKECGLKEKEALHFYSVEEARRKIETLYHRKGYPKSQVTIIEGNRPEDRGVVFAISEGPLQRITSVAFTGNSDSIASDGRLKTQIESKPGFVPYLWGGKFDHEKLAGDIQKLTLYYRNLGFFRARVGRQLEYDSRNRWVRINFIIDEGPRYVVRSVSVIGNQKFASDSLLQPLQLKAGDFFNFDRMQSDKSELIDLYGAQGYIFADIKAEPRFLEEPGELDLVYDIAEGEQFRVGKITVKIAGEYPHTKERVVLDRLSIHSGDIVDIREIRNSERRLKASQLFTVNPAEGEPPQIVFIPPELGDAKKMMAHGGRGSHRGQSPDDDAPRIDIEVLLPRSALFLLR